MSFGLEVHVSMVGVLDDRVPLARAEARWSTQGMKSAALKVALVSPNIHPLASDVHKGDEATSRAERCCR